MRLNFLWEKFIVSTITLLSCAGAFVLLDNYNAVRAAAGVQYIQLETPLDKHIPLWPIWVTIYFWYYPWVLLILPIVKGRRQFYHGITAYFFIQTIALITYYIFPSHMNRPELVGDGFIMEWMRFLYWFDKGFNIIPSLHVGHSMLVALFYWRYNRKWFPLVFFGAFLISCSAVVVKQHYIIDLPPGLVYTFVAFYGSYYLTKNIQERNLVSEKQV